MMRPVYEAALLVPDIFSKKADSVTFLYRGYTRCEVDVVLDQDSLARRESKDKPLMRRSHPIVGQYSRHDILTFDLNIALSLLGCP